LSGFEEFYWDDFQGGRFPIARPRDERFLNLGLLLTSDIQRHGAEALEVLQLVELAREGKDDIPEWGGNATFTCFRPDGVEITDLSLDPRTQHYSLDEVHDSLIQYWDFLCPTIEERRRSLQEWAEFYTREHPEVTDPLHPCMAHLPLATSALPYTPRPR